MFARILMFLAAIGLTAALTAQTGHPAKGSWTGDLVASAGSKSRIRLLIDDHNGELNGKINPGRNAIDMSKIELDSTTWTMTINATTPEGALVMTGVLSNLGSWTNRKYIGTYTQGSTKGNFDITLK